MAKRKKEKALGHDPFADFDVFDIEGPAPAAEPPPPAPTKQSVPKKVDTPEFKVPVFTPKPTPLPNQTGGETSGRAFSIADFFTPANKKQEPVKPLITPKEAVPEELVPEEPADIDTPPEPEPTQTVELVTEDDQVNPTDEEGIQEDPFSEAAISIDLPEETVNRVDLEQHEQADLEQYEQIVFDLEDESSDVYEDDEDLHSPLDDAVVMAEKPTSDESDITTAIENQEEVFPSDSELQGLLDTAELALAEEHLFALATFETTQHTDNEAIPANELEDEYANEDLVFSENELETELTNAIEDGIEDSDLFILDNHLGAELADKIQDKNEDSDLFILENDLEAEPVDASEDEDEDVFMLEDESVYEVEDQEVDASALDTVIDENDPIWGATTPLDPDLGMSWEAEEAETAEELPNWLTADVSTIKLDTGMLQPLVMGEEEVTSEPDLDLDWEENAEDNTLPNWLTEETSASRIDTDKLHPIGLGEEDDDEGTSLTENEQPENSLTLDSNPIVEETHEPDHDWLTNSDDHLWHTAQLSPQDAPVDPSNMPWRHTRTFTNDVLSEDFLTPEPKDQQTGEGTETGSSTMPKWIKAHLESGSNTIDSTDLPAPTEEDHLTQDKVDEEAIASAPTHPLTRPLEMDAENPANVTNSLTEELTEDKPFVWPSLKNSNTADFLDSANADVDWDLDLDKESATADPDPDTADFDLAFDQSTDTANLSDDTDDDFDLPDAEAPTEVFDTQKLPDWLNTEESFTLFSDDEEEEEQLLAEDLEEQKLPSLAEQEESADESLEFLDEEDVFGFEFDFYEAEDSAVAESAAEIDIEFDDTAFSFDEIENEPSTPRNVDLDNLLSKYSSLPTTQILSSPLPYEEDESQEDDQLTNVLDDDLLFDFDFDKVDSPVADDPFSFDNADPFASFEIEASDEEIDVDALLKRYASPDNQATDTQPAPSPQPAPPSVMPPQTEAGTDPLTQLLHLIDNEMVPLPFADTGITAAPESQPQQTPEPSAQPLPTPVESTTDLVDATTVEEYVVFKIAQTFYAISLDHVQEITPAPQTTYVPNVPSWVLGVTNLHGEIFSVVDVRRFLKLPWIEPIPDQRMLAVYDNRQEIRTGLLVDGVTAIKKLTPAEIEPLVSELHTITEAARPYVYGRYQEIIILNLNDLLMSNEMRQFEPVR